MRKSLIVACLAPVVIAACGGGGQAATTINVSAGDFAFTPNAWTVPAGQQITIVMTNTDTLDHEWVLNNLGEESTPPFDDDDEGKIHFEVETKAGETQTTTFTAPTEAGAYQVVCGIEGHLEAGMTGTLTVESG